jgi:hypothetical protein
MISTVQELIDQLKKFDPLAKPMIYNPNMECDEEIHAITAFPQENVVILD